MIYWTAPSRVISGTVGPFVLIAERLIGSSCSHRGEANLELRAWLIVCAPKSIRSIRYGISSVGSIRDSSISSNRKSWPQLVQFVKWSSSLTVQLSIPHTGQIQKMKMMLPFFFDFGKASYSSNVVSNASIECLSLLLFRFALKSCLS